MQMVVDVKICSRLVSRMVNIPILGRFHRYVRGIEVTILSNSAVKYKPNTTSLPFRRPLVSLLARTTSPGGTRSHVLIISHGELKQVNVSCLYACLKVMTKFLRVSAFSWWHCMFFCSTVLKAKARSTFSSPYYLCRSAFAVMPGSPPQDTSSMFSENDEGSSSTSRSKGSLLKHVPPHQLLQAIGFKNDHDKDIAEKTPATTATPLWNLFLPQRLSSPVAFSGTWIASSDDQQKNSIDSVSHVEPGSKPGSWKIQLFCRDSSDDKAVAAAMEVAKASIDYLLDLEKKTQLETLRSDENTANEQSNLLPILFSALDSKLWEKIQQSILSDHYQVKNSWEYPCGIWIYQHPQDNMEQSPTTTFQEENRLPPNNKAVLRPLTVQDAQLVDSRWEYRSAKSIDMIQKMLTASETTHGGSYGLEVDGTLVAWVCRYLDGTIGMLWTEEEHRRKGYGAMVVQAAVQSIVQRQLQNSNTNDGNAIIRPVIAFTVDTNDASRGLLARMNWQRVQDADWVGFSLLTGV
jgi:GNAT superfamily N-acetyltransferase